jgi:hypothetical protein
MSVVAGITVAIGGAEALHALAAAKVAERFGRRAVRIVRALYAYLTCRVADRMRRRTVPARVATHARAGCRVAERCVVRARAIASARGVTLVIAGPARRGRRTTVRVGAAGVAVALDAERGRFRATRIRQAVHAAQRRIALLAAAALIRSIRAAERAGTARTDAHTARPSARHDQQRENTTASEPSGNARVHFLTSDRSQTRDFR